jgi:hypothetical protein
MCGNAEMQPPKSYSKPPVKRRLQQQQKNYRYTIDRGNKNTKKNSNKKTLVKVEK